MTYAYTDGSVDHKPLGFLQCVTARGHIQGRACTEGLHRGALFASGCVLYSAVIMVHSCLKVGGLSLTYSGCTRLCGDFFVEEI